MLYGQQSARMADKLYPAADGSEKPWSELTVPERDAIMSASTAEGLGFRAVDPDDSRTTDAEHSEWRIRESVRRKWARARNS
jgi:hypothetical protein